MPRQQLYRSLPEWLALNSDRFQIRPSIRNSSCNAADIKLSGLTKEIRITLSSTRLRGWPTRLLRGGHVNPFLNEFPSGSKWVATHNIAIAVDYDGFTWDLLGDFDLQEVRQPNGYVNGLCLPEFRKLYPTRESLWINELFESLLRWVNGKLASASWLILSAQSDSTWANLVMENSRLQAESLSTHVKTIPLYSKSLA
jgi:hypothetical protein